jgi:hypothetical protein
VTRPTTRAGRKTGLPVGKPKGENDTAVLFRTTSAVKEFIDAHGGATKLINALLESAITTARGTK